VRVFIILAVLMLAACANTALHTVNADGADRDSRHRADLRVELASAYYAEGQYTTALKEVDTALTIDPTLAGAHGLRGLVLMQVGQDKQAERSLREALRLAPDNPDWQNNMGWFICQRQSAKTAMPYFLQALSNKTYSSPQKALLNSGLCSLKDQDVVNAESYFLRALQFESNLVLARVKLAKIYFERGELAQARRHIVVAVQSEKVVVEDLMMAIHIERKLGNRAAEKSLVSKLKRLYPDLPKAAVYFGGETDE
jgi:type IV pilus assembly protein PilF